MSSGIHCTRCSLAIIRLRDTIDYWVGVVKASSRWRNMQATDLAVLGLIDWLTKGWGGRLWDGRLNLMTAWIRLLKVEWESSAAPGILTVVSDGGHTYSLLETYIIMRGRVGIARAVNRAEEYTFKLVSVERTAVRAEPWLDLKFYVINIISKRCFGEMKNDVSSAYCWCV